MISFAESQSWRPDVKGWSLDILPKYHDWARELPDGARILELGVFHGRSLLYMAEEFARLNKTSCEVWGVDTLAWKPEDWGSFLKNLAFTRPAARDLVHFMRCDTVRACRVFEPESFDLIFIDAEHDEASVRADIEAARPLVKRPGGIIAGHDYVLNPENPHYGVKLAVDSLFGTSFVEHYESIWWRVLNGLPRR